jgi:SAM-dependent methyltransferase
MTRERGLANVEVLCRDARSTELPRGSFDFVTARLVLVNVPNPEQIVAEAVALARPGGWVAFHEADWIAHVCDPPSNAWTTLVELFVRYSEGQDRSIHRSRMPRLRDAGLDPVHVNRVRLSPAVAFRWTSPRT